MAEKKKPAPLATGTGLGVESFPAGDTKGFIPTRDALQEHHLRTQYRVRPALIATIAQLAFGGVSS